MINCITVIRVYEPYKTILGYGRLTIVTKNINSNKYSIEIPCFTNSILK